MTKPAADELCLILTPDKDLYVGYVEIVGSYHTVTNGAYIGMNKRCRDQILNSELVYCLAINGPSNRVHVHQIPPTTLHQPVYIIRCTAGCAQMWLNAIANAPGF